MNLKCFQLSYATGAIARGNRLESHSIFESSAFIFGSVPRPRRLPAGGDETGARDIIKQQSFVLAADLGAALLSNAAQAGQCPAGKISIDATKPVATPAKGVTDTVLSAIDLSQEPANIAGRTLRLRKLLVQPGGVVPWHSHGDRPAIIYIVEGTITEYASNCAVSIVHKAGDVARETSATSHWWKNNSHSVVTLLSAGVLHDEHDHNM